MIGPRSADQRQPGSQAASPTDVSPRLTTWSEAFGTDRTSSGASKVFDWRRGMDLLRGRRELYGFRGGVGIADQSAFRRSAELGGPSSGPSSARTVSADFLEGLRRDDPDAPRWVRLLAGVGPQG